MTNTRRAITNALLFLAGLNIGAAVTGLLLY